MNQLNNDHFERYLKELDLSGKRTTHVIRALTRFNAYLEETDLDYTLLKPKEAQGFQIYLTTQTHPDGTVCRTKASTLNIIGAVTGFYNFLKRNGVIHSNPFLQIDRVKRNRSLPKNILNETDMNRLLASLCDFNRSRTLTERRQTYRLHVIAELMYSTGARINEIVKLTPEDIDLDRGTVTLRDSKTGKTRQGFLNETAKGVLKLYLEEIRPLVLFERCGGDPRLLFGSGSTLKARFNKQLAKVCKSLKLGKITSHHFRHALGFHLLRAGVDIRYIQGILGHHSLSSTQVYTKVDKEDLKGVIDRFHPRKWKHKEHRS